MRQSVELMVGDKLLRGTVLLPEKNTPLPTVIFFHGFTMDRVGLRGLHEQFARECVKNGLACVRFDFYGLGESEGDFCEMTPLSEVEQAVAIYKWTCEQPFADAGNVFLAGHSLGGAVAAMTAPRVQPKALVLWAATISLYLSVIERGKNNGGKVEGGYDLGGILLSDAFVEEVRRLDIANLSQGYHGHALLVHGSQDEQVQVESVYLYEDVYKESARIHILEGADHQFSLIEWRKKLFALSIEYIKKELSA
ncbi:hypothetical protein AGMMS49957_08680 [Synergistales bacterium]|nr:hypothetical protein AGMMS49957_08680 [Synergistales bacterium]